MLTKYLCIFWILILNTQFDFLSNINNKLTNNKYCEIEELLRKTADEVAELGQDFQNYLKKAIAADVSLATKIANTSFKTGDEFVDIIIHANSAGEFIIKAEGKADKVLIKTELASIMNSVPTDKKIRLLSCNDEAAAKELSGLVTRSFYVSDGWVDIYQGGQVYSKNKFYKYQNGTKTTTSLPHNATAPSGLGSKVRMGVNGAGNFASHVDIQASLSTIINLNNGNKLTKSIGSATDIELAAIHRYTENGGVLNTPMRNGSETVLGPVTFTQFELQVYQHTISGLTKLRQTNRIVTGTVIRGRTYSLADYNTLFNSGSTNVPLKGMVSCTKNEAVAIDFLTTSGANISGSKVKVIMKIKSKNGVDIYDMSDWGVNLVNQRHPGALIQEEVFLEEGMFKKLSEPKKILNPDGSPKKDIDGTEYWEIELEELGTPLRTIN